MATTEQGTPPEAPAKKETKATTRTYIVLECDNMDAPDRTWREIGSAEATTDQQAIAKVTKADEAGTWIAVPERSFRPRTRAFDQPPPKPVWS